MSQTERIMDHDFADGWCVRCGRSRIELVAYGHPDVVIEVGNNTGLSCEGSTTTSEIESLRQAWRRDREKWDKVWG